MALTLEQFERIVLRLANQTSVRYWKHWNYPQTSPWKMAVNVSMRDSDHRLVDELAALGIVLEAVVAGFALFTCERQLPDSILTLPMAA